MQTTKQLTRALAAIASAALLMANTAAVQAETSADDNSIPVIEISMADEDPLEKLKEQVINERAKSGKLDLSTVDMGASSIKVDHFDQTQQGLSQVNVSVNLVSVDKTTSETQEDGTTVVQEPSISFSFTEPVTLRVKSSDAPQILLNEDYITLTVGDTFDPNAYIGYTFDASRVLPAVKIENWVDTSAAGTYWCHYLAVNQSGKETSTYLRVDVKEKEVKTSTGVKVDLSSILAGVNVDGSVYGMLDAINAVRAENGLYAYSMADTAGLTAAAVRATEASYYLSHTRPDGTPYYTAFDEQGVGHGSMYECLVAYGSSIEANLGWWLSEPGHAAIILGSSGSTIAIGYANGIWSADVY